MISFSLRPDNVFRKPCLIYLRRLAIVGLKGAAYKYCNSSGLDIFTRMLFTTVSDYCVPRGTYHILAFLFMVPLIICFSLFWIGISCLSSVMVHPSSHKTHNNINGAACIFGKMWICLARLLRPGS